MKILFKNMHIVDSKRDELVDILTFDGIIMKINKNIEKNPEYKVVDLENKMCLPAFVDLHVHFRTPGFEYKEDLNTGLKAAVAGGYTSLNLMANTKPICSKREIIQKILDESKKIDLADINQAASITKDFDGKTLTHWSEIKDLTRILSDDGIGVSSEDIMKKAMIKAKQEGFLIMLHEEDEKFSKLDMRIAENEMTKRDLELAKNIKGNIHICHVSTKEAVFMIESAKKINPNITCEVTPHHFSLVDIDYKVNPPIRKKQDVDELINAIRKGTIDAISTDHAPHSKEDKEKGAFGMIGLETAFALSYTNLVLKNNISLSKLSELMSYNPAKILSLNKGLFKEGMQADFVVVDLKNIFEVKEENFKSKSKNSPFIGQKLYGKILETYKRSKLVYKEEI